MTCALSIAEQGHPVALLEKESELGGYARKVHYTLDGMDVQEYLQQVVRSVYRHPAIHVYHNAEIEEVSGYVGNFVTSVNSDKGRRQIKHGAAVVATGAEEYRPAEYLYGEDERVLTQLELEERIVQEDEALLNSETLVMIQCVGCRNEDRDYCARICCGHAIKNSLKLKEKNPELDIYVLFRDMRTYGFREDFYRDASENDVKFIRFTPEDPPQVEAAKVEGKEVLQVAVTDPIIGDQVAIDADHLVLSAAIIPSAATEEVAGRFKVTLNPDGFFKEAHAKLKPVEFAADGVYLCGLAQYPKDIQETVNQAYGAAGRVLTLLSKDTVVASGAVAGVAETDCISCGACITACTYDAIEFRETDEGRKAWVNPVLCKGDGLCNTKCPTGAVSLKHFTDEALLSQIDAAAPEAQSG
jgi:heterodisulfide reductase subunit A